MNQLTPAEKNELRSIPHLKEHARKNERTYLRISKQILDLAESSLSGISLDVFNPFPNAGEIRVL